MAKKVRQQHEMKQKKNFLTTVKEEISKSWLISIATYVATALALGFCATLSPYVPLDFKQRDVLFVFFALLFFLCVGIYLVVKTKGWLKKTGWVFFLILCCSAAGFYIKNIILYNLALLDSQAIIIFYPDSFHDKKLRAEMENAMVQLPKTLNTKRFSAKLISRSSRFSGNIDDTIIGKYLKRRINVIGVIDISENEKGVMLELYAPALKVYKNLGFSWVKTEFLEETLRKEVKLTAGFENVFYSLGITLDVAGPHYGSYSGSLAVAAGLKDKVAGLADISGNQNLPVPEVLEFPLGNISRGIYFTSLMLTTGYSKLSGYDDSFCNSIELFTDFDVQSSSYNIFKQLNPVFISSCLLEKTNYIEKIYAQAAPDQQEQIVLLMFASLFRSDKFDFKFAQSNIISKQLITEIQRMREKCSLLDNGTTIFEKSQLLAEYVSKRPDFKSSYPLLWRYLNDYIEKEFRTALYNSYSSFSRKKAKTLMVYYNNIFKTLGNNERSCEMPWDVYFINFFATLGKETRFEMNAEYILSELDMFFKGIEDITTAADCANITLGPEANYDFFLDKKYQEDYKQNVSMLALALTNDQKINTFIEPFINVLCPFIKAKPCTFNQETIIQRDNVTRANDFFLEYITPLLASFTSKEFISTLSEYGLFDISKDKLEMLLELKLSEISKYFDDNIPSEPSPDIFVSKYFSNLQKIFKDPINQEIFRLISLRIDNPDHFSESSLEPVLQKNPVHTLLLLEMLNMESLTQKQMDSILGAIETLYPEQRNSSMYRHFKMLQERYYGNEQAALDLAALIALPVYSGSTGSTKTVEQSFYQFYIDTARQPHSDTDICNYDDNYLPGWTNYLLESQKGIVVDHIFSKSLDEKIWAAVSGEYFWKYAYYDNETNAKMFEKTIRNYLLQYALNYLNVDNTSQYVTSMYTDEKLLHAIDVSKTYCSQ